MSWRTERRAMSVLISAADDDMVPPEIVSTVFYSATVSDALAILVAENVGGTQRLTWGNEGAVQLLGYGLEDLRALPVAQLFPALGGGELKLLVPRGRASRMTLSVRTPSGADVGGGVDPTPSPGGRMWGLPVRGRENEQDRVLRPTARP